MKLRSKLTALAVVALSLSTVSAFSAVKAGASCSKAGAVSVIAGKKFTCVKSGKKLIWNQGVLVAAPKVTPAATPSALGDTVTYSFTNPNTIHNTYSFPSTNPQRPPLRQLLIQLAIANRRLTGWPRRCIDWWLASNY
jgi:hypothetical protein